MHDAELVSSGKPPSMSSRETWSRRATTQQKSQKGSFLWKCPPWLQNDLEAQAFKNTATIEKGEKRRCPGLIEALWEQWTGLVLFTHPSALQLRQGKPAKIRGK